MRKGTLFTLFLLLIGLVLFSVACSSGPNAEEYTKLESVHQWVKQNVSRKVVDQIDLPTSCPEIEGSVISWSSSDPKVIDNTGKVVARPSETKKVELKYTIQIGKKVAKEYILGVYVSANTLSEVEAEFLALIPEEITESIAFPNVYANGAVEVIVNSSNEEVLKSSGDFKQPIEDTEVTLSYIITDGNDELTGSVITFAKAKTEKERLEKTVAWLNAEGFNDLLLDSESEFPTAYEAEDTRIYWSASNKEIYKDGKIVQYVYKRHVTMTATIIADTEAEEIQYFCEVKALDTSNMSEAQIVENFISAYAVDTYYQLSFNQDPKGYYGNLESYEYTAISNSYGFINFHGTMTYTFHENWIPVGRGNRPGTKQPGGTQYIAIHDTAGTQSSSDAANNSSWCTNPTNGTSWHYTVDCKSVWQQLPTDEIAYHAGDGRTRSFALIDTGMPATSAIPVVTLENGYYHINGVKTNVTPFVLDPEDSSNHLAVPLTADLNQQGVLCEIGENGNYFLGRTYINSDYNLIANYGGNTNSIGIESCVNTGADYGDTARILANFVAQLMIENNLEINRVRGHHYFSGKPCPNAILLAGWWSEFLDLVAYEKFAMENFEDLTFAWTTSEEMLTPTGKINKKATAGTELEYAVKVTKGESVVFEKSYKTVLA